MAVGDPRLELGQVGNEARLQREVLDLHAAVFFDERTRFGEAAEQLVFGPARDRDVDPIDPDRDRNNGEESRRDEDSIRQRRE